jgi:hypothetical protein
VPVHQVTRLEQDPDAATTELQSLRGEQARAEPRIRGPTDDRGGPPLPCSRPATAGLATNSYVVVDVAGTSRAPAGPKVAAPGGRGRLLGRPARRRAHPGTGLVPTLSVGPQPNVGD